MLFFYSTKSHERMSAVSSHTYSTHWESTVKWITPVKAKLTAKRKRKIYRQTKSEEILSCTACIMHGWRQATQIIQITKATRRLSSIQLSFGTPCVQHPLRAIGGSTEFLLIIIELVHGKRQGRLHHGDVRTMNWAKWEATNSLLFRNWTGGYFQVNLNGNFDGCCRMQFSFILFDSMEFCSFAKFRLCVADMTFTIPFLPLYLEFRQCDDDSSEWKLFPIHWMRCDTSNAIQGSTISFERIAYERRRDPNQWI